MSQSRGRATVTDRVLLRPSTAEKHTVYCDVMSDEREGTRFVSVLAKFGSRYRFLQSDKATR